MIGVDEPIQLIMLHSVLSVCMPWQICSVKVILHNTAVWNNFKAQHYEGANKQVNLKKKTPTAYLLSV